MVWQHHRTYDHRDTEDCTTVQLTEAVGRYPAGAVLCDVLADMALRISGVEASWLAGFHTFALNAWLAPYAGGATANAYASLNAWLRKIQTGSATLDAWLVTPTPVARSASFSLNAVLLQRGADGITVLTQPIGAGDTVIHIDNPGDFPATCPFLIQIGLETMTVVSGCGTNTWTVVRGDATLTHPLGDYVVTC